MIVVVVLAVVRMVAVVSIGVIGRRKAEKSLKWNDYWKLMSGSLVMFFRELVA